MWIILILFQYKFMRWHTRIVNTYFQKSYVSRYISYVLMLSPLYYMHTVIMMILKTSLYFEEVLTIAYYSIHQQNHDRSQRSRSLHESQSKYVLECTAQTPIRYLNANSFYFAPLWLISTKTIFSAKNRNHRFVKLTLA